MTDSLMVKVDKLWRRLAKLDHADQLQVLAELTWRVQSVQHDVEEERDSRCLCEECSPEHVKVNGKKEVGVKEGELVEITDASPPEMKDKVFRVVWASFATSDRVGPLDGKQFRRVHREWIECGRPMTIRSFILDQ